ncbi:HD-like signal output (HDOD) domain, no enzymatic activity [Desulfacinum hydrothermale DSM 13146]|uniref:HD-like signal output (HDOD) domain, no enzymatic activity n=1 Tax=Desulfacinum hydrothermale DSM 13146 TaxID=1121390 RepID=A0A1W1XJT2_9BACT|nr:response regulator [Desulfacinum hydrothermale]SMC24253.1 HD-like signal output (HDOD) domain, no enzymatic activity [Desulfacinum hydrothermale DSM 13146]
MQGKILFVDDESNVLQGLRRMLRPLRKEWTAHFCTNAKEALELMAREPVDVVVSDMRMPGIDGAQFLLEVKKTYPDVIRIALSGYSEEDLALRAARSAHQYLAKPCEPEKLVATIQRVQSLRQLLAKGALRDLVSGMDTLPSLPSLYEEIMEELESEDPSIKRVGEIIGRDVGMTAKILQLVNSAFFGLTRHVSSPEQAVTLLGLNTIKALVLSSQIFSQFQEENFPPQFLDQLWTHSLNAALCAKTIAQESGAETHIVEDAFMAGMLHDVGKLILMHALPEKAAQALDRSETTEEPLWKSEEAIFGTSHAELGAYLLGVWGLPDNIVEATAFHHCPGRCPHREFSALTAVHTADVMDYALHGGPSYQGPNLVDQTYLSDLGVLGRLKEWKQVCHDVLHQE